MDTYKSFNEMAEGTGALDVSTGGMMQFVDNMSPKLTSIPPFQGCQFCVRANEIAHGGKPEKPHVHIDLPEGEVKCWISEGPNRNEVILAASTIPKSKQHVVREVVKHLKGNWASAAHDWNNFIDEDYPKFSDDEQCKIPVDGAHND